MLSFLYLEFSLLHSGVQNQVFYLANCINSSTLELYLPPFLNACSFQQAAVAAKNSYLVSTRPSQLLSFLPVMTIIILLTAVIWT